MMETGGSLSSEGKILLLFAAASRDADLPNMPAAISAAVTPPQICSQVASGVRTRVEHEFKSGSMSTDVQLEILRALS